MVAAVVDRPDVDTVDALVLLGYELPPLLVDPSDWRNWLPSPIERTIRRIGDGGEEVAAKIKSFSWDRSDAGDIGSVDYNPTFTLAPFEQGEGVERIDVTAFELRSGADSPASPVAGEALAGPIFQVEGVDGLQSPMRVTITWDSSAEEALDPSTFVITEIGTGAEYDTNLDIETRSATAVVDGAGQYAIVAPDMVEPEEQIHVLDTACPLYRSMAATGPNLAGPLPAGQSRTVTVTGPLPASQGSELEHAFRLERQPLW